ncbi:MAG: helix-turn-helix transcriptional regulator [Synechococcus sp.]
MYRGMVIMIDKVQSPLMLLRKRAGLNQQDLARLLGVSRTTIMRWETGRATPKLSLIQVKALCRSLGVTVEDLPDNFAPQPIPNNLDTLGTSSTPL